jgi:hypothetical protein
MWCPLSGPVVRVRRSSRPVSGRLVSSASGVHPSGVQPRLLSASVCPDASISSTSGGGGDQVEAEGDRHHRNGSSPGGLPRLGTGRSTAERARTRVMLPRSRWSVGSVADPGQVGAGAAALDRLSDQAGQAGVQSAVACGWAVGRLQREVAAAAAWLPSSGWEATTVGGGHGACRPGERVRKGRWACRPGWACGPSAARAGSGRSRLAANSAVTWSDGWWACQDLNLGPHPYQGCALTA